MEYLTIKEVADKVGISQQAIYSKIRSNWNDINDYVRVISGKKMIALDALDKVFDVSENADPDIVEELHAVIASKDHEIKRLNDEISHLHDQVDSLLRQNENLSESLKLTAQTTAYKLVNSSDKEKDLPFWKRLFTRKEKEL
jgi:predicted DNA-binding protein YlxM (UPF0122 family)